MSTSTAAGIAAAQPAFLSKERIIAKPGFNRWLVPPAALAIHLCIGMAYGFSVFWLPLSKALGISAPVACALDMSFIAQVFSSQCDWPISMLGWIYTLFFIFLGCSAAIWGGWLEHAGPRKAGVVSALCWCGGLLISALGIYTHQIWLMWIGSGGHWRYRPGPGLYLARVDPDQVVPGQARHGHRHGDHGLRRRRDGGGSPGGSADGALRFADQRRRVAELSGDGGDLLRVHDRVARCPTAFRRPAGSLRAGPRR
jgi:hypothetical protein